MEKVRAELCVLTVISRKTMEASGIVLKKSRARWEEWITERKEFDCSRKSEVASIQLSI